MEVVNRKHLSFDESIEGCYVKYSKIIIKFLSNYIHNIHIAEEIMQEVFLKVCEKRISLDPESPLTRNYLFSMAKNSAFDYLRRMKIERKRYNEICIEEVSLNGKFYNDLENSLIEGEIISTLYDTINSLPGKRREVFIKKIFLRRKNIEIIRELKISGFILNRIVKEVKEEIRIKLGKYFRDD